MRHDSAHPRSIVNITSVSAEVASPERADYCISKAGLSMWVKNLALRLAAEGIGVFEVRPGIIRTDMTAGVAAKYDALIDGGLVPVRRWGEAADVGAAVAALAARQARLCHRLRHQCRRRAVGAAAVRWDRMT